MDLAGRLTRPQPVGVFPLLTTNRVGFTGPEQPAHDTAGRGIVVNAPRVRSAQVLGGASQSLGLEITEHELRIVAADRGARINDIAAAEDLDLHAFARAAGLDQLVDELFHREI